MKAWSFRPHRFRKRRRCNNASHLEALADRIEGIEFGPCFQWIDALWTGPKESLARLRRPETVDNTESYWCHPGLLDACFQVACATLQAETDAEVLLPFCVKSLQVLQTPAVTDWWCHARQVGESIWDIRLFDASGAGVAEIHGLEMRRASSEGFLNRRVADWMYRVEWQLQALMGQDGRVGDRGWLIVDEGSGLGGELAQRLKQRGQHALLATAEGDVPHLLATQPTGVIYSCGADADSDAPAAAEAACLRLLELDQNLSRTGVAPRLCLVTEGCQAVGSADSIQLAPALI